MLWKGIWVHPYTVMMVQGGGQILENWGLAELRRHCLDFVVAVNHPTVHHTSIIHVYEVFEHLHMLWKGIWVHPYSYNGARRGQILENWGQAEQK